MPPIITEPKKLSMPQQVEKNREDIKEIFKKIDGLDTLDNVVVIDDLSHVLTPEEVKSLRQPVAFIIYNNHIYLKRSEASNIGTFQIVFSITGTSVITFDSSKINAYFDSGTLEEISSTLSTYSQTRIDTLLSDKVSFSYVDTALASKASLSGADFTGEITAPSIIQNMVGFSFQKKVATDGTLSYYYAGIVQTGNKLTLVIFGSLNLNSSQIGYENVGEFTLPLEVANKIIPYSGTVIEMKNIALIVGTTFENSIETGVKITKQGTNTLRAEVARYGLVPGSAYNFRIEETFLLSNNLAQ